MSKHLIILATILLMPVLIAQVSAERVRDELLIIQAQPDADSYTHLTLPTNREV